MKLKAPEGVGDPCIAGVTVTPRDAVYEVDLEVGALMIECFGFVEVGSGEKADEPLAPAVVRPLGPAVMPKLSLPAWRANPTPKRSEGHG
jgi:hypothetical protein